MSFGSGARATSDGADGRVRFPLVGLTLGAGIVVGVAIGFVLWRTSGRESAETARRQPPPPPQAQTVASVERQVAQRRLAAFSGEPFPPLHTPDVVLSGFVATVRHPPPYTAVDATVFDAGDTRIKLADVWPVGRLEVCMGPNAVRFACGLMGRATLQNFLAGRTVVCQAGFLPAGGAARGAERALVVADCEVGGRDLGTYMVENGLAFPAGEPRPSRTAALAAAQAAGRGVWAGRYDWPDHDRSLDDMAANPQEMLVPAETGGGEP